MHRWTKRLFALAAPLLLTGCLWGPGKFTSDLTLLKNGSFILDYKGEIILQNPENSSGGITRAPWTEGFVRCYVDGRVEHVWEPIPVTGGETVDRKSEKTRPCTSSETAKAKAEYDRQGAQQIEQQRASAEQTAKLFGLGGLDDQSMRAFAAKLMKYAGWRSVTYRGKGVFDVDYHFEGRATQDFLFPALPDNNLIIPFIALRRRSDGSVLVTAPAYTGGSGPMSAATGAGMPKGDSPVSRAQGRFTVITDGEILTNNSEDGAAPDPRGRAVHWDVSSASNKVPETLINLR